jgi:hypothetical protein
MGPPDESLRRCNNKLFWEILPRQGGVEPKAWFRQVSLCNLDGQHGYFMTASSPFGEKSRSRSLSQRPFLMSAIVVISATLRCQAGFFCEVNGITFPYSSLGIHFVAFFLNLPGTKNLITFAIDHPIFKNRTRAKKFSLLTNLYRCFQADSAKDTGLRLLLTTLHFKLRKIRKSTHLQKKALSAISVTP